MTTGIGDREKFARTWATPRGFPRVLSAVNNQPIGLRFLLVAYGFLLSGGALALLMRVQLAVSENTFLGPHVYNQLFTMHGSTMMYLFAVPFLEGFATYLLPLHLGARDLAFPRVTAFGFWVYLFGGLLFYVSFLVGEVPAVGWFAYAPLSGPKYSGLGTEFWLLGLGMIEFAGIAAGAELVISTLKTRAPGMTLTRMPLFAWTWLVVGAMIIFAFTTLLMATLLLELDRAAGTHFFNAEKGGTSLLWQHLFWFFGHPEVYIIFLPATGIVSMVVATAARRLVGYTLIAVAVVLTGFVSFGLWVHHMYTTGLPELSLMFFAAASLMIALASGTQVFAWIATLWGRRPQLKTHLLYVLGFIFIFVLGGLNGVMVAVVPFDLQAHDSYFLVAHFHYVLIGGAVFPALAGVYYWSPKLTGRLLSERLGKWGFWLNFVGFNVTFFPMHIMGLLGQPRRVYTYPASQGLDGLNLVATVGAFVLALGFLTVVLDVGYSLYRGEKAGNNPWGADTLEWSVESPPPAAVFADVPVVGSRHPLWEGGIEGPGSEASQRVRQALTAAPDSWRATVVTDALWGEPQGIQPLPGPSYDPLLLAIGLTLMPVAALLKAYLVAAAAVIFSVGVLIHWLYPRRDFIDRVRASGLAERAGVPVFLTGTRSVGWWGAVALMTVIGTAFTTLLYSYFYLRLYSFDWPQDGLPLPEVAWPTAAVAVLLASAGGPYLAGVAFRRGLWAFLKFWLGLTLLGGLVFLLLLTLALLPVEFTPQTNAYGSVFFSLHGFLALLTVSGLGVLAAALVRLWRPHGDPKEIYALQMQITAHFWYFVVAVGVVGYATLYLSPYVL